MLNFIGENKRLDNTTGLSIQEQKIVDIEKEEKEKLAGKTSRTEQNIIYK